MDTIILGGDARMKALAALLDARRVDEPRTALALLPTAANVVTNVPPKLDIAMEYEIFGIPLVLPKEPAA